MIKSRIPTISILIFCLTLFPFYGEAKKTSETVSVIKTFNDTLLSSMKQAEKIGFKGRYDLLEPVIKETFALYFMGRKSIGKYWKTLNKEQKSKFLDNYTKWTIANYAGSFDDYSGETFKIISEMPAVRGTVSVNSHLVKSTGEIVEFDYRLREFKGKWRIVDILMSGVSQLAMTRSQFINLMKKEGIQGLNAMLIKKTEFFSNK